MQYKGLINELIASNNKTEIIVMAETVAALDRIEAISELEVYLPFISNENIYNSLYSIQPDLIFKSRYVPFYKYITVSEKYYLQSLSGWKNWALNKKFEDTLLGQHPLYKKWTPEEDSLIKYMKPFLVTIDNSVLSIYKKTLDQIVTSNKKVVIVIPPIYLPTGQTLLDLSQFRKTLSSLADNKNIYYFDFSEFMVDKKYFYNVLHLNATGAVVFSNAFADSLNKLVLKKTE